MSIKQLTVFVENKPGTLVTITDTLAANNVNIRALSLAETQDFGVLRMIVNDLEVASRTLSEQGFLIKTTEVIGVKIGDDPGKLTAALQVLKDAGINMEYLYAFMARTPRHAYVVIRVEDNDQAEAALEGAGFHLITEEDINKL
ncbi:MAG: ACT domain-containing protein [Clostridia bacterium]|nr:ACT domain-containing protein [Clostridia bacterium]MBO4798562.1 ACT domain-containing protein [Candidatus Methanomethylophilaceae archaeon]